MQDPRGEEVAKAVDTFMANVERIQRELGVTEDTPHSEQLYKAFKRIIALEEQIRRLGAGEQPREG